MTSPIDQIQRNDVLPANHEPPLEASPPKTDIQTSALESALIAREKALKEQEGRLQSRLASIASKEKDLESRLERIKDAESSLAKHQQQSLLQESLLEERARTVALREMEAEAGFANQNQKALAQLTEKHRALRDELQQLQAQLDENRLKEIERLESRLAEERRVRLAAVDSDIETLRKRAESNAQEELKRLRAQLRAERDAHDEALAAERHRLSSERLAFEQESDQKRASLTAKEAELHRELAKLKWREEELAGLRACVDQSVERRAREKVTLLEQQLDWLRSDYQRALDARTVVEKKLDSYKQLCDRFNEAPEVLLQRLDAAEQKKAALEQELLARPSAADRERLIELQQKERVWSDENSKLIQELTKLRADETRWVVSVQQLEAQRDQREIAQRRLEVLRGEMEKYAQDVNRIRALYERPEERAARVEAIETPWRTDFRRATTIDNEDELGWLKGIIQACERSGMRFPERLVYAFHTSLKAAELSPLTVLAGVSGTGKSELPRLYSRFGGLAFLPLAVQPNWDSPQSLFGFFNSVDNRFNATPALRALVQAQHSPEHESYRQGLSDRVLLVLLDEMNLAHVEQYFSDLLSRLEQRRGESRDVTLDIDLGAGMTPYPLCLGRNVLWAGTMNEDETTKALSDKVIDRSNLLYFPRPRKLHSRKEILLAEEAPLLAESTWRKWLTPNSSMSDEKLQPFCSALEAINGYLEHVGRALGHRVWQAMAYYIKIHPESRAAGAQGDLEALQKAMHRAFEDQLVLKVMPKLRGIETSGNSKRNCLDPIRKLLESPELGLSLSEDFEIACRVGYGSFVWNSARYLEGDQ